jgi:23S rRNA (adenine2030-N6)-methyltransferase
MNYKHSYHAGNFADVFKHIVLMTLIEAAVRKEKPLCYLETHAGRGLYYLHSESALKTAESDIGIHKLFEYYSNATTGIPENIEAYIKLIRQLGYPDYYSGSPRIAAGLLRKQDRLILMELEGDEHQILRKNFKDDPRVAVHQQNGYLGLKAFLPPLERRGLILIDPAFEKPDEWKQLLEAIKIGLKQFPTGVFAIWYPIKDLRQVKQFLHAISKLGLSSAMVTELNIYPADAPLSLFGSGMLIINPPFQCAEKLEQTLPWVWKALAVNGAGGWHVQTLVS